MKPAIFHKVIYLASFIFLIQALSCTSNNTKFPILILASNVDFGLYTAEILKAEGYNEFIIDSLNSGKISSSYLAHFDLVILPKCQIDPSSKKLIEKYVSDGGNLIAFRPDETLSSLFGIIPTGHNYVGGYIDIDSSTDQGKGITSEAMQFHGPSDVYTLSSAKSIATIFADNAANTGTPGVVSHTYGEGHGIAFLYNLPKSIVYTRQGNPLFAGIEKDGILGLRAMDLFTDGWVDTSKNTLNQADQQMAFLSHCIESLSQYAKPLPHFWYFPDSLKCLVVLDNDGEDNGENDFEAQFRDIDSMGAKMTIYIKDVDKVSKKWVDKWSAKGFEIAAHPDDTKEAKNPTWHRMDSVLGDIKKQIKSKYGLTIRTNVNHWFVWTGKNANETQNFAAQAQLEENHGIEMDANYAHYDINSNQGEHFLGPLGINQGNYMGSGLPMKFANAEGKTVNVYQRFNAVYDQQYMESKAPDDFFYSFKGLMDRSLNDQIYDVISIKAHNNEYHFSKDPLLRMMAYATQNGIPVWTAKQLLEFLKMKDEASFTKISWSNNHLSFLLNSSLKHSNGLSFMIPADFDGRKIKSITIAGKNVPYSFKSTKGFEYAFVTVQPGKNYEVSAAYSN